MKNKDNIEVEPFSVKYIGTEKWEGFIYGEEYQAIVSYTTKEGDEWFVFTNAYPLYMFGGKYGKYVFDHKKDFEFLDRWWMCTECGHRNEPGTTRCWQCGKKHFE